MRRLIPAVVPAKIIPAIKTTRKKKQIVPVKKVEPVKEVVTEKWDGDLPDNALDLDEENYSFDISDD